jgi:hypothetical protein
MRTIDRRAVIGAGVAALASADEEEHRINVSRRARRRVCFRPDSRHR